VLGEVYYLAHRQSADGKASTLFMKPEHWKNALANEWNRSTSVWLTALSQDSLMDATPSFEYQNELPDVLVRYVHSQLIHHSVQESSLISVLS
jgi:hypothetical protein